MKYMYVTTVSLNIFANLSAEQVDIVNSNPPFYHGFNIGSTVEQ
jgi:tRNA1(Val) A37 N6-methylase TrmN6